MRNLKRVLSLTLASVMLLGMMVIGSSAAGITKKDFTDADEIEYTEAVDVMVALEVLEGSGSKFAPKEILTREQAAKIICYLLLGPENAEKLGKNTVIFKDVAADRWSAGYIAYCAQQKILSGVGNGNFDPTGELTGVAFGKMLLVALGYDPSIQKYTGTSWAINVAADMIDAGIDVKGTVLTAPLSREQAAQMTFQTLEADMVYHPFSIQGYLTGDSKPTSVTWDDKEDYDSSADGIQQFCEKYFPDLEKVSTTNSFGRPADEWILNNDSIGKYTDKEPVLTYINDMTTKANDVAKDLKNYKVVDTTNNENVGISETAAADATTGNIVKTNGASGALTIAGTTPAAAIAARTGNGKVVEVYANKSVITDIVVLEYKVDAVNSITESKDGDYRKTTYSFDTFTATALNSNNQTFTDPDKDDTIVLHGDIDVDDVVTILTLTNETHVYTTTKVTGAQDSVNTGNKTITVDGATYTVGTAVKKASATNVAIGDFPNVDKDYDYYLDVNGFVVKSEAVESKDYAVIDAIKVVGSDELGGSSTIQARLIFADGTPEVVVINKINDKKPDKVNTSTNGDNTADPVKVSADEDKNTAAFEGQIVTYSKRSDDKYDLTIKTNTVTATGSNPTVATSNKVITVTGSTTDGTDYNAISKGVATIGNGITVSGNGKTVYIVKTENDDGDAEYASYVGFQNVPTIKLTGNTNAAETAKISYVLASGSTTVADYVFIDASNATSKSSTTKDMVYIFSAGEYDKSGTSDVIYTYTKAALNGDPNATVKATESGKDDMTTAGLYEVTINDKGEITAATKQDASGSTAYIQKTANANAGNEVVYTAAGNDSITAYQYNSDTVTWIIDGDEIGSGSAGSVQNKDTVYIKVVDKSGDPDEKSTISVMYVVKYQAVALSATAATTTDDKTSIIYFNGADLDTLTATPAGGEGSETYQWKVSDNSDMSSATTLSTASGATGAALTLENDAAVSSGETKYFTCDVTDSEGTKVTTNVVAVEVKACVITMPNNSTGSDGTDVNVTVNCAAADEIKASSEVKTGTATGVKTDVSVTSGTPAAVYTIKTSDNGTITITVTVKGDGIEDFTKTADITVEQQ